MFGQVFNFVIKHRFWFENISENRRGLRFRVKSLYLEVRLNSVNSQFENITLFFPFPYKGKFDVTSFFFSLLLDTYVAIP